MDHPAALSSARWEAAAGPAGPGPTGAEGAGGSGCGARGWRQGQAKYMHTKYRPMGGRRGACRAWPGFETTRRAKLAARTASGRAGPAAVGDQAAGPEGARNTSGVHQVPPDGRPPRGLQGLVPLVRRAPEDRAAVPVGGGRAWPGFETTRRAKLAARTASGRAAAHGHTKQRGERTASTLRRRRVLGVPCS